MKKTVKQSSNPKKKHDDGKHVQEGAEPGTVRPAEEIAEEIADDEVEIEKTGGKPGTESTPISERKP
jgi:hypothetical protein